MKERTSCCFSDCTHYMHRVYMQNATSFYPITRIRNNNTITLYSIHTRYVCVVAFRFYYYYIILLYIYIIVFDRSRIPHKLVREERPLLKTNRVSMISLCRCVVVRINENNTILHYIFYYVPPTGYTFLPAAYRRQ